MKPCDGIKKGSFTASGWSHNNTKLSCLDLNGTVIKCKHVGTVRVVILRNIPYAYLASDSGWPGTNTPSFIFGMVLFIDDAVSLQV